MQAPNEGGTVQGIRKLATFIRTGSPEDIPYSSLTLRLPQSPTLFTRAKLSHCVGFGAGRAVYIFENVVRHLLLFFRIISMYYAISGSLKFQMYRAKKQLESEEKSDELRQQHGS